MKGLPRGDGIAGKCDEVLSDSDDSFEVLPQNQCQCPDRILKELKVPNPTWDEQVKTNRGVN